MNQKKQKNKYKAEICLGNFNPKKVGGGQFDSPCGFSKNVCSKERVKPFFFCDF